MRVVAGEFKGRKIHAPTGHDTRPTSDRVREALFSALVARLGTDLSGASVLDAFAGSGALGIEALSRGARRATFVERDRRALTALRRTVEELEVCSRVRIVGSDVFRALRSGILDADAYSLLFLDPPYRINKAEVTALVCELGARGLLVQDAIVVWEHGRGEPIELPEACELDATKRYGSTEVDIVIWRGEGGQG